MKRILVIDDDRETCDFLTEIFSSEGWSVQTAQTADGGLELAASDEFDCVVTDINLNDRLTGLDLLRAIRQRRPATEVVLISGFGTLETAVEAVREGAFDFVSKPFNVQQVIATIKRAMDHRRPGKSADGIETILQHYESSGIIGRTPKMIELYKEVARAAPSHSTVLLVGESGTGKELIARAIHAHSTRAAQPFIAFNCGALTETLLEAELFGHVKGSFTGAVADKRGLFEEADQGTILLDEIGETSPALQVKLLRVLQEGEIKRVGDAKSRRVDVRVIAATNRHLEEEVKAGRFREDLFYRLSVVMLTVPPLRERREDIPLLAAHLLKRLRHGTNKQRSSAGPSIAELRLTPETLEVLMTHTWPGNVRELENAIEHAAIHARGGLINPEDLPEKIRKVQPSVRILDGEQPLTDSYADLPTLDEMERRYLLHVLKAVNWNRSRAAEILGIDRRTLYRMAERFGVKLDRPDAT